MSEMLKVTGSRIKGSAIKPSKAITVARPGGYTAATKRWEEQDRRAREFKEQQEAARAEAKRLNEAKKAEKVKLGRKKVTKTKTKKADEPIKIWDNYTPIADIPQSNKLRIVIAACTKDGYRYINIRQFYYAYREDQWKPGRNGINIPLVSATNKTRIPDPNNPPNIVYPMRDVLAAIQQAIEVAEKMALDDPDNAVWKLPKVKTEENSNENR